MDEVCHNCGDTMLLHQKEDHAGLCCDCFDLSCGMPLELLNEERLAKGKKPLSSTEVKQP